jgi:putative PIN family toxin of toxin-antitoxin system
MCSLSALFWRGTPYRCILAAQAGLFELLVSDEIIEELSRVLTDKFRLSREETVDSIQFIRKIGKRVEISRTLKAVEEDPEDDKFIEAAIPGNADYIVSGDHHLLKMHEYENIQIINATDFLKILVKPE